MVNSRLSLMFLFLCAALVFLVAAMIIYPDVTFEAGGRGLRVWWDVVLPALLPFFIAARLMMGLGIVSSVGVLFEPLMRPLFNLPGASSFVLMMGLSSGYPLGAVLTGRLRRDGMLTKTEGERLVTVANTSSPLFMSGAVAVGMFGQAALAWPIMMGHYAGALITGLAFRHYKVGGEHSPPVNEGGPLLTKAYRALLKARREDGRHFGQVLADSVRKSVDTTLLIGGFIVLFSVVIQLLTKVGALEFLTKMLSPLLKPVGADAHAVRALIKGFFEISLGAQATANLASPVSTKLMVVGAIISWGGLSVHAQVAAVLNDTDLDVGTYVLGRIIHAVSAGFFTRLIYIKSQTGLLRRVEPVFDGQILFGRSPSWAARFLRSTSLLTLSVVVLLAVGFLIAISSSYKIVIFRD